MSDVINIAKQKLTKSDWIKIITEWEKSSEKQKAFCRTRNITYSTFFYWYKQLKKTDQLSKKSDAFVAIKTTPSVITSVFKINFPNGIYVTVPAVFDKASLELIFELLSMSAC